jgi:hypothetical protein
MLLRAAAPNPENLPSEYGVVILSATDVLSKDQALDRLTRLGSEFELRAEVQGTNLIISVSPRTPADLSRIEVVAESFSEGIRRLSKSKGPAGRVRVVGFKESLLVSPEIVQRWFSSKGCSTCSVGIGYPIPEDSADVAAVVYLGY